jgi:hypothetical protein
VIVIDSLYQRYVGHCPLCDRLNRLTFWELAVFLSVVDLVVINTDIFYF